ncbi:MAG: bi-domain-containing oxidoreductase [Saprospiraceae bacterium]
MKQIIQDLKSGNTILEDIPIPLVKKGYVLIKTYRSLVSLGTEKMLVEFGKASYLEKARQQPEKVKQVIQKIKTDGLQPTLEAVFRKLGEPLPLGYSNAGEVIAVGDGVSEFKIGDRVASNGNHAEIVCIPENLVAKIPDNVSYEDAAFTVIGAIGLQGIRLINPTFGETILVTGLGLIGLISAQLLKANGCKVIGVDFDEQKLDLARKWGIEVYNAGTEDIVKLVSSITNGIGVDGVLITASTKSNDVISEAAQVSRKRGRIVLVGVIGLDINRSDFYEKELTFQVSCSYGPGRYDENYENKGYDYPIGFVRWTEKRNFVAILQAISNEQLIVNEMITERVALSNFNDIYGDMHKKGAIASILEYTGDVNLTKNQVRVNENINYQESKGIIGIVGAGNFTTAMIAPVLKKLKANVKYICSSKGLSGTILAKKYGFAYSTTDYHEILQDADVSAVVLTTRHNQHAKQILQALKKGKHVFVEKPLALSLSEIDEIEQGFIEGSTSLMIGFNRRFSPFSIKAKNMLSKNQPISVIATMNAGHIPIDHWVHDINVGGGRIIGEACHYIDLISFFTGSNVKEVVMNALGPNASSNTDNATILLRYENGSQGVINYLSEGSKEYQKERIEIYDCGRNILIDNFRSIQFYGYKERNYSSSQDKGHTNQFKSWHNMILNGGPELISVHSLFNTSKAAIACIESLQNNSWVQIK